MDSIQNGHTENVYYVAVARVQYNFFTSTDSNIFRFFAPTLKRGSGEDPQIVTPENFDDSSVK